MLGSVDANTGSPDLGWDTDQFPMDVKNATFLMKVRNLASEPLGLVPKDVAMVVNVNALIRELSHK